MRKLAAVLIMILSAIGCVLCLAVLIGALLANEPATVAVTGALDVADGYLDLAGQTTEQVAAKLEEIQQRVDTLPGTAPEQVAQAKETLEQEVAPVVAQVKGIANTLRAGIVTVNETIEQVNRLPGVDLPPIGEELQSLDQRVDAISSEIATITSTLAARDIDGEKLVEAADKVSEQLATALSTLEALSARIVELSAEIASAKAAIPGLFDTISWTLALVFALLGAGQVSLFMQALQWFRTPPPQAT